MDTKELMDELSKMDKERLREYIAEIEELYSNSVQSSKLLYMKLKFAQMALGDR